MTHPAASHCAPTKRVRREHRAEQGQKSSTTKHGDAWILSTAFTLRDEGLFPGCAQTDSIGTGSENGAIFACDQGVAGRLRIAIIADFPHAAVLIDAVPQPGLVRRRDRTSARRPSESRIERTSDERSKEVTRTFKTGIP